MKYTNLKAFEKYMDGLTSSRCPSVHFVIAKEAFERKKASEKIISLALQNDVRAGQNYCTFDCDETDIRSISAELQAFSFLNPKRVILILQVDKLSKAGQDQIRSYFAKPNPTICLILEAAAFNKSTNFYKDAEKYGTLFDAAEEKPWEKEKSLQEWLIWRLKAEGKSIEPSVAALFVKQQGTDQMKLDQECEKLICYVGDKKDISAADISAICMKISQDTAWQLGEAIFKLDGAEALRIAKSLLKDGTALIVLLRQIRTQFQTDYQVSCMLERGSCEQEITAQYPYMKGNILSKHIQQAKQYGQARFKLGLQMIDETEFMAKNSVSDSDWLTERLIFKLVAK